VERSPGQVPLPGGGGNASQWRRSR
jgi:hypothetical protein